MAEKIGLEAVLELGGFRSAVSQYNSAISGMSKNTVSVASSISSSFAGLGNSILSIGAIAGGAALAGVTALGAGLATFAVSGIKQAIDLDQQVANIAATMGATRETAGTLKEELKGLALDLSLDPNLTVDVTQAGEAIQVLAANGALATDEFGKLTQASKDLAIQTVALANATGSDFTTAATIATDAAALFNLQANEMGKAVDGAAGIMNASKFDAQDYQLALSNAGGIAAEMGLSIEDFNTVIAGTASNFASGSDAGTSFKTLLQRLANPTDEVKAAMQQYGISLFDAEGNMRDMADVAQDLNQVFNGTVTVTSQVGGATKEQAKAAEQASEKIGDLTRDIGQQEAKLKLMNDVYQESLKFYDAGEPKMRAQALAIEKLSSNITDQKEKLGGYQQAIALVDGAQARTVTSTQQLTEAQKAQLAATLGGADGSRILLGLADLTAEEFDALSESVNRTGQGMEAAALRVDTVKGAMDIFKGVLQAVMIQVGDKFLPLLKEMAVSFTKLATQHGPAIVAFFGQVATTIGNAITNISAGIGKISGAFQRFGVRGAAVSILGQLGFTPEAISSVTSTIDTILAEVNRIQTAFSQFGLSGVAFSIGGLLGLDSDSMIAIQATITEIITAITGFATQVQTLFQGMGIEEFKGALLGIGAVLAGGVFAALVAGVLSLLTPFTLITGAIILFSTAWAGNWGNIQGITTTAFGVITEAFNQFILVWNTNWPIIQAVALTAWEILQGIFAGIQEALGPVIEQLVTQFTQIGTSLAGLGINWQTTWDAIVLATGIVAAAIGAAILGIIGVVVGLATGIGAGISATIALFQGLSDNVLGIFSGMTTAIMGWIQTFSALLSGDFAGAWEGFKVVMRGSFEFWTSMWGGILEAALGVINIMTSTIGGFADGIVGFFQGMYDKLVGHSIIPDLINDIVAWFKKLPQLILNTLTTLGNRIQEPFEGIWDKIKKAINLEEWATLGTQAIEGLLEGMKERAGDVLEFIKNLAADSLKGLGQFWGANSPAKKFIPLGESVPQGIGKGINDAASVATNAMNNLMGAMNPKSFLDAMDVGGTMHALNASNVNDLKDIFKLNSQAVMDILGSGGGEGELSALLGQQAAIWNVPPQFAQDLAQANGLFGQLIDQYGEFARATRLENLGRLTQMAASFAGLGSTFAGMLEEQMAGADAAKKAVEEYQSAVKKLTVTEGENQIAIDKKNLAIEKASEALDFGERQMDIYRQELATLMLDEEGNALQIEKKILQMDKLTESMDAQSKTMLTLQDELNKLTGDMEKNQAAVAKAEKSYKELQAQAFDLFSGNQTDAQQVQSEIATIALLEDFLKSGAASFLIPADAVSQAAGITGILYDQISGQQELNRLLAEQARREELITAQKEAQQKLDFLKSQLDLINLGRQLGGNIFQGITFGLDASVEDLLAATNAVTQAMVNQINEDLQIASPSKVMIKTFKQVMAGAAIGMERGQSMLTNTMRNIPLLNGSMPVFSQQGGATSNNQNTYNYNFPMTVNTAASASGVIRQYEIKRSMYAN